MANWIQRFLAGIATHKGDASAHHAKAVDNELYGKLLTGLAAARPAVGTANRWYYSTDTKVLEYDTGAAWVEAARGESATRLAQLSEKAHGSLTGVSADQHHAQAHSLASHSTKAHTELTGVTANQHHTPPGDGDLAPKAHKDSHDPIDGSDKLDSAVPVKVGAANAIGSSHSLSRADHVHEREHAKTTAAGDITSGRFPVNRLPAMTDEKIWKGTGGNVEEIDVPTGIENTIASDILQHSNDANKSTTSDSYVKLKEIALGGPITNCRVKFAMRSVDGLGSSYARIYKNGGAIGTEQSKTANGYATKSEDLDLAAVSGDLIQIYARKDPTGTNCQVKEFRLYYSLAFAPHTSQDP